MSAAPKHARRVRSRGFAPAAAVEAKADAEPASEEGKEDGLRSGPRLTMGQRVLVSGLASATTYNGSVAVVAEDEPAAGLAQDERILVFLRGQQGPSKVKRGNLQLISAGMSDFPAFERVLATERAKNFAGDSRWIRSIGDAGIRDPVAIVAGGSSDKVRVDFRGGVSEMGRPNCIGTVKVQMRDPCGVDSEFLAVELYRFNSPDGSQRGAAGAWVRSEGRRPDARSFVAKLQSSDAGGDGKLHDRLRSRILIHMTRRYGAIAMTGDDVTRTKSLMVSPFTRTYPELLQVALVEVESTMAAAARAGVSFAAGGASASDSFGRRMTAGRALLNQLYSLGEALEANHRFVEAAEM